MASARPPTFGQLLKQYRIAAGLTQEALAERAGLAARTISDMERGLRSAPYRDTLSKLVRALKLSPAEQAQLEAAARRPSPSRTQRSPGTPTGLASTPPETPMGGTPPPASAPPPPEPGIGVPAEACGGPSSAGALPPTLRPSAAPPPTGGCPHPLGWRPSVPVVRYVSRLPLRVRDALVPRLVRVLLVGAVLGISLLSTGVLGPHPQTGGKLCLATDLPTSGDWAWAGKPAEHAVNLAVMQNQVLGKGYTLKVINYDDRGPHDLTTGLQNVQQMVRNPCIVGMVGPYNSSVATGEMPVAANAGLVMVSPSNTNPALTLRSDAEIQGIDFEQLHPPGKPITYFRIAPNDVAQAIVDADITFDDLEARSAYVVNDRYHYGEELASEFTQRFQVKGGRIVGAESILPGNPSLIAQVAASIVASRPDAVFYGGITENGGGLLKAQLIRLGYAGSFVGGDGIAGDPRFVEQAGANAANGTFATVAAPDPSTFTAGAAARFIRDYHARYPGQGLDGYSANAYDAAMLLITAIKRLIRTGQEITRVAVIDQVQNTQYAGVTGPISFDSNGDVTHGVYSIYKVQDGRWVLFKQVIV
jgi:branched-chain amino acid transport system substrate-binding protein